MKDKIKKFGLACLDNFLIAIFYTLKWSLLIGPIIWCIVEIIRGNYLRAICIALIYVAALTGKKFDLWIP
ncbi:hypothetical protein MZM54_00035 [[Brevibacterium] frigoritolerans]|nr:hypothetical protein [Peribacillus frigoritolerans]